MKFELSASNTGNVELTNLRMTNSYPIEYTQALQGQLPLQSTLAIGESNVLVFDTANSCTADAQCGASERCINDKCLIDISNFLGEITFGAILEADFLNAQGVSDTTSTTINLPIIFEQDAVIYRTNVLNENFASGTQIVVDREADGTMEAYTYNTVGSEGYATSDFIAWTVNNRLVYKCGTSSNICISQATGLDKDSSHASLSRWKYLLGGSLTTSNIPTEPYLSINCGGTKPCQERYSVAVAPPTETCSDGVKNQDETDVDCGGLCEGCNLGNDCLIATDCLSGICTDNICVEEGEEPTENPNDGKTVVWRTGITDCVFTSWTDNNDKWVAFDNDNEIQTPLKEYGWTSTWSGSSRNTDDFPWFTAIGGTSPCGYSIDAYSDQIYALNIQGDNDAKFDEDVNFANPIQLNVDPCCGYTCGTCCERYSDGTSNC